MVTTIQISKELKDKLSSRKIDSQDRYEDVIWDLLEDTMELSEQTKKDIALGRKEIREGKFVTHEQLKKQLGI